MKAIVVVVLTMLIYVLGGAAISQGESAVAASFNESEALDMARKWTELVGQANVAELEKLLSDNYLHIHGTALVESKIQFLDAFKNGTRRYDPIKPEELYYRGFGSFAIVTGKFQLKAYSRGRTVEGVNRFGLILAKTPRGNEVVSFQATAVPQQN